MAEWLRLQELEKLISVTITDSPHQIMLSLRGYNLNAAFESVNQVLERNARYEELLRVWFWCIE
jgi:hypothetical protein